MTEDALAEQPALEWLRELGWVYAHGSTFAPDVAAEQRPSWSDVVLRQRLAAAVSDLNPDLPASAVSDVVAQVVAAASPVVIDDHAACHDLLLTGVRVSYRDAVGAERDALARLVDFDEPGRNEFLAVNQFTIITGQKNRRPDVLLFVNGIPLAQLELKDPGHKIATPAGAVNQVRAYAEVMPQLYRFVELIGVSDLYHARVGTITSQAEHFSQWKSMDPAEDEGRSQLEVMVRGVFAPERLLELVEGFVLFQAEGPRLVKVLAKYHQVDAVQRALEATREAMGADGRAGVVWHTQGAGKSLTMVFYAQAVRRDPGFENPTIVAVTDRRDLDDQLFKTFAKQRSLAPAVRRAEEISGGDESLRSLLDVPAGGIVFTTIQKFRPLEDETAMPVLSDRRNVIVIVDEAHRTQYSDLARNVAIALPNAVRIGFTGTPIERHDRSTAMVFGDYVSVYSITRAIEDGATVPIYYESRRVPIDVADEELLEEVDEVLEDEEQPAASRLVTRWAQLARVVGADERVRTIADDISSHYTERCGEQDGKALVVCMSREIAARIAGLLKERLGADAVTCVMSVSPSDDPMLHGAGGEFRRSKAEMEQVATDFKDPEHPLRVVVVRDMWLTGFDAPCLNTLYVDKPMRDHGLLQAIARVNRVFRDKPGGLVVDYIGIGEDLRKSLAAYDQRDVEQAMISVDEAMARLREKHGVLASMLHGFDRSRWSTPSATPAERATLLCNAVDYVLAEGDLTKRFLKEQTLAQRWYKLARTHPDSAPIAEDLKLFKAMSGLIRKIDPPTAASLEAEQAVRQFFSEGLAAGEVVDVLAIADGSRPEISVLSDDFLDTLHHRIRQDNLRRRLLEKLLNDEVQSVGKRNPLQGQLFADKLRSVLSRYEKRLLTSAEVIEELIRLAKELRDARHRHEQLGLTEEEASFYDALAGGVEAGAVDIRVAEIAHELVERIRADLTVDWASRESTQAALRRTIKRLLRRHAYTGPVVLPASAGGRPRTLDLDGLADLILDQARMMYATWPEDSMLARS